MKHKLKKSNGYIALISAIVISALLIIITTSLSLSGFFVRFNILDSEYKERSSALAEACGNTAILRLAQGVSIPANEIIAVDTNSCTIVSVTETGSKATIKTKGIFPALSTATSARAFTTMQIGVDTSDYTIASWHEI